MKVAIQVPAIAEPPDKFRETLQEIRACSTEGFEADYQAWITPVGGDPTPHIAEEEGFTYYEAAEGKLNARNQAHDHAVANGADVIVTIDADASPLRADAIEGLVHPILRGPYVASNSTPVSREKPGGTLSLPGLLIDAAANLEDSTRPHMHGQASAFSARAWEEAGPFRTGLDQYDIDSVREEEEFDFYDRVGVIGPVARDERARFYNDPRRHYSKIPLVGDGEFSERVGEVTFNPRD